jgi:hypothetical protein
MKSVKINLVIDASVGSGEVTLTRILRLADVPRVGEGVFVEAGSVSGVARVRDVVWRTGRPALAVALLVGQSARFDPGALADAGWERA